ncbi:MAG: hypothetical protein R3A47_11015 [Polyangiales bacterium]
MNATRLTTALLLLAALFAGCAKNIPNTTVSDSDANRRIVDFMESYRTAVSERNVAELIKMASPQYLDDNGSPIGDDDIDYESLKTKLGRWADRVQDVRYEIKYQNVSEKNDHYFVEFRYTASFRVVQVDGEAKWTRRVGDHRVELIDNGSGGFWFLSGM